MKVISAGSERS